MTGTPRRELALDRLLAIQSIILASSARGEQPQAAFAVALQADPDLTSEDFGEVVSDLQWGRFLHAPIDGDGGGTGDQKSGGSRSLRLTIKGLHCLALAEADAEAGSEG